MLIACVLCYQISSGRYTTKEQGDILEKKLFQYSIRLKCYINKVKCKAHYNKIRQSQLNMHAVLQVFPKLSKILLARGYRLNKREQNVNVFMKKVIPRSVRLIWSAESQMSKPQ